jgi:hypothetical protein
LENNTIKNIEKEIIEPTLNITITLHLYGNILDCNNGKACCLKDLKKENTLSKVLIGVGCESPTIKNAFVIINVIAREKMGCI